VTWVKICGITNIEDALMAVEAGADALGFVFYQNSPRNIDPRVAQNIVAQLPQDLETVGVFVEQSDKQIHETAEEVGLSAVQLHRYEIPGSRLKTVVNSHPRKLFLAVSAATLFDRKSSLGGLDISPEIKSDIGAIFLESGSLEQPGGTGRTFDWNRAAVIASSISKDFNLVVAGGLHADNVAEAIQILKPWGVDVSSGVESKPGQKDPAKIRAFINRVRETDKAV
jgi:phosphoribosylanthranilate isomerase